MVEVESTLAVAEPVIYKHYCVRCKKEWNCNEPLCAYPRETKTCEEEINLLARMRRTITIHEGWYQGAHFVAFKKLKED